MVPGCGCSGGSLVCYRGDGDTNMHMLPVLQNGPLQRYVYIGGGPLQKYVHRGWAFTKLCT